MPKAVIITHAHPSWGGAKKLDENIRTRVKELNPELLISLDGHPEWDRWEGNLGIHSQKYEIDGALHLDTLAGNITDFNGNLHESLKPLVNYDEVFVMGGYWTRCHLETVKDLAHLWKRIKKKGTIVIPSDCVTDNPEDYKNNEEAIMSHSFKVGDIHDDQSAKGDIKFFSGYWIGYDLALLEAKLDFEKSIDPRGPDVIYKIKK